jgi:uncharacterized membrane protein YdfJ with MMPL/SSD domain
MGWPMLFWQGWSDRAAICLAIEKTAGVITTAGLIMAVSFAGLLIPKTIVLNQVLRSPFSSKHSCTRF